MDKKTDGKIKIVKCGFCKDEMEQKNNKHIYCSYPCMRASESKRSRAKHKSIHEKTK